MAIVVLGAVFVDIKGYPDAAFIPAGRNVGHVEYVHGGVSRNVAEDIANVELRPIFVSLVDESGEGADVLRKLNDHKVNTKYIRTVPDGMGTWLAIFSDDGDVYASISKRPSLKAIGEILEDQGDEIFAQADSVVLELDMEKGIVKRVLQLAQKFNVPVYAMVSNMSIAQERRDFLQKTDCFICNQQEAGILFSDDYSRKTVKEMEEILASKVVAARIPRMIVTMGGKGAVFADMQGEHGFCPPRKVEVKDTTGAGDAFCAGAAIGLTYGKTLSEACEIGSQLAASVIVTSESVCPRFLPQEFGIDVEVEG